jgi:N-acetylglucosaminyldiphosphoundecaprenol N-acetyl-beta-D-mannosaminyltransferase
MRDCPPKQPVLGVGVSATNYGEVMQLSRQWIETRRLWKSRGSDPDAAPPGRCTAILTVHAVMTAVLHPEFKELLNAADVATPDGMPLAWALRSFGVRRQPRVYGPDVMLALCAQAADLGHRIFLVGGREETIPELCRRLRTRYPGLMIVGTYPHRDPPATEDAARQLTERIIASDADIVLIGFGQPRQERWMAAHRDRLAGVVMVGVGAAFDFHAGRVRQAPRWMQRAGLEWFFRLLMEPRRLWRRYLLFNPLFLAMWALQKARVLRYAPLTPGLTR